MERTRIKVRPSEEHTMLVSCCGVRVALHTFQSLSPFFFFCVGQSDQYVVLKDPARRKTILHKDLVKTIHMGREEIPMGSIPTNSELPSTVDPK